MLHLRILALICLLAVAQVGAACVPIVTWRPAVRGEVVYARDGRPVPGVPVYVEWETRDVLFGSHIFDLTTAIGSVARARTNAEGDFFIPGGLRFVVFTYARYSEISVTAEHPVYDVLGSVTTLPGLPVRIAAKPYPRTLYSPLSAVDLPLGPAALRAASLGAWTDVDASSRSNRDGLTPARAQNTEREHRRAAQGASPLSR